MATVAAVILKDKKKMTDLTWNVLIRVSHKSVPAYIKTNAFVTKDQLTSKGKLKPAYIEEFFAPTLKEYRTKITRMGDLVDGLTAYDLRDILEDKRELVDFVDESQKYIDGLRKKNKETSAVPLQTVVNSIKDYFGRAVVPIENITSKMLNAYESYLRSERKITRPDQFGEPVTTVREPMTDNGVHNHMANLRLLFGKVRDKYNDEDTGYIRIKHYPFKKYKVKPKAHVPKGNRELGPVLALRDTVCCLGQRDDMVRDLFLLSFYLCGMNAKDIFDNIGRMRERVEYNRSKTMGRRRDRAFISINIPDVAGPIIEKYADVLPGRYSDHRNLNKALSIGLRRIVERCRRLSEDGGLDEAARDHYAELYRVLAGAEFMDARHIFASVARNVCGFSKDDIAAALNHVDQYTRITDTYIAPDWSIVDRVQAGVLALLQEVDE